MRRAVSESGHNCQCWHRGKWRSPSLLLACCLVGIVAEAAAVASVRIEQEQEQEVASTPAVVEQAAGGACKPNAAGCCDYSGEWCNEKNSDGIMYVFTQPTGTCTVSANVGGSGCLVPHCYNGTVSGDTMSIVYVDKHTKTNTTRTATLELATPQDILQWHYPGPNGNSRWYRGGNTGNYTCRRNSTRRNDSGHATDGRGGIKRVSSAGTLELPPFEAATPAAAAASASVRIDQAQEQEVASTPAVVEQAAVLECLITASVYAGGARPDNVTVNTKAIQAAIDECHAGSPQGSRVVVPAGAFKTGSLMLRSNQELHLAAGAGLYGSDDESDYPVVPGLPFGTMFRALISGYNLTNVKVTGSNLAVPASGIVEKDSIIDGVGWSWWCIRKGMPVWPVPYCKHFNPTNKTLKHGLLQPKLVEFFNCSKVEIRDFTAQNSPFWTVVPTYSRDVTVQRMTVLNPRNVGQTDGVDPDSCVNCLVEDCHIDVGDDGVSIKAYDVRGVGPAPCSNVTIRRTNVISRNICVGGATEGGVSDILFEDVSVGDPDTVTSPWAIKFKVSTGHLRNITFRRLKIGRIGETPWMYPTKAPGAAFYIDIRSHPNATAPPPTMEGLTFEDISVVSVSSVGHISGPQSKIKHLTLRNVSVERAGSGWGVCGGVDLPSFMVEGVSPPPKCK